MSGASAAEITAHLLDERVIAVRPSLVKLLGSPADAIVFQQISYWMPKATAEHDGETWVYKTYAEWAEETGLPATTVKGAVQRLEAQGLVVSCQPEGALRRKWYRIAIYPDRCNDATGRIPPLEGQNPAVQGTESAPAPLSTESTQETSSRGFAEFWAVYPRREGRKVGKKDALKLWVKMTLEQRKRAYYAAQVYAVEVAKPGAAKARDAVRFLRDEWYEAFMEPAEPQRDESARPSPVDGIVDASVAQMRANMERMNDEDADLPAERTAPPEHLRRAARA